MWQSINSLQLGPYHLFNPGSAPESNWYYLMCECHLNSSHAIELTYFCGICSERWHLSTTLILTQKPSPFWLNPMNEEWKSCPQYQHISRCRGCAMHPPFAAAFWILRTWTCRLFPVKILGCHRHFRQTVKGTSRIAAAVMSVPSFWHASKGRRESPPPHYHYSQNVRLRVRLISS